jgi:hypothetical protein
MRKPLMIALAVATMAAGFSAGAQVPSPARPGLNAPGPSTPTPQRSHQIRRELTNLDRTIDRAEARHRRSSQNARRLRRDVADIRRMHTRFSRNGLTSHQVRILQDRVNDVRRRLRMKQVNWSR